MLNIFKLEFGSHRTASSKYRTEEPQVSLWVLEGSCFSFLPYNSIFFPPFKPSIFHLTKTIFLWLARNNFIFYLPLLCAFIFARAFESRFFFLIHGNCLDKTLQFSCKILAVVCHYFSFQVQGQSAGIVPKVRLELPESWFVAWCLNHCIKLQWYPPYELQLLHS